MTGSLDLHCLMKRLRSAEPKPFLLNILEIFLQKPELLFSLEKSLEIARICSIAHLYIVRKNKWT